MGCRLRRCSSAEVLSFRRLTASQPAQVCRQSLCCLKEVPAAGQCRAGQQAWLAVRGCLIRVHDLACKVPCDLSSLDVTTCLQRVARVGGAAGAAGVADITGACCGVRGLEQDGAPPQVRFHSAHQGGRAALFGEEAQSYLGSLWFCSVRPIASLTAPGGARAARGVQRRTAYTKMLCKQP